MFLSLYIYENLSHLFSRYSTVQYTCNCYSLYVLSLITCRCYWHNYKDVIGKCFCPDNVCQCSSVYCFCPQCDNTCVPHLLGVSILWYNFCMPHLLLRSLTVSVSTTVTAGWPPLPSCNNLVALSYLPSLYIHWHVYYAAASIYRLGWWNAMFEELINSFGPSIFHYFLLYVLLSLFTLWVLLMH